MRQHFPIRMLKNPLTSVPAHFGSHCRMIGEKSDGLGERRRLLGFRKHPGARPLANYFARRAIDPKNYRPLAPHIVENFVWIDGPERRIILKYREPGVTSINDFRHARFG